MEEIHSTAETKTMDGIISIFTRKKKINSLSGVFDYISNCGPFVHGFFTLVCLTMQEWKNPLECANTSDSTLSQNYVQSTCLNDGISNGDGAVKYYT